ncbi:hypothetical protein [Chroococcidiopsis sp. SAG 2025]|uniref:hypothetical protein n=1 Tax=Chroococcidiopsis sp. SAG 2025 TaxID=171389 RepID=UPI0029370FB6|nr:hypothetical protein [Chroococcidiopsis sp. SAG 2025]
MQLVVHQHWDSYDPPRSGYQAAYLHQVTPEHTLFGWLYNDEVDDLGRSHVPYFFCYYIAGLLHAVQLENIFTCLHKGPEALINRQHLPPATLENVVAPDLWSYQPARVGVVIPSGVRERSQVLLKQKKLLELFASANEEEMEIKLNKQFYKQQEALTQPSIIATPMPQSRSFREETISILHGDLSRPQVCDRKSDHSVATSQPLANTKSHSGSILTSKQYAYLEKDLIDFIGPIAPTLLRKFSANSPSLKVLVEKITLLLTPNQRIEFEKKAETILQQPTTQPKMQDKYLQPQMKSLSLPDLNEQALDNTVIRQCEQALAGIIGPIASFIVQKTLASHPQISLPEFVETLAAIIPDLQQASTFRQRLFLLGIIKSN